MEIVTTKIEQKRHEYLEINKPRESVFQEKPVYDFFTRIWQTTASIGTLFLLSPILALVAFFIKITSPGPVLYKLERIGKDGKRFCPLKLRTLRCGADRLLRHPDAVNEKEVEKYATWIGKLLRKTKFDEIPQLVNVIRGEMNLVGPRPARIEKVKYNKKTIPNYDIRFRVKPGLSGEAQIWRGYNTPDRNKLLFELEYIRERSILLDLKIIFLTVIKILIRWVTPGFALFFLLIFLTFIPEAIKSLLFFKIVGIRLNLFHLFILFTFVWLFISKSSQKTITLYKTSIDLPVLIFSVSGIIPIFFASNFVTPLRGISYYMITGFGVAYIIINSEMSGSAPRRMALIIAVIAVLISLLGIIDLFVVVELSVQKGFSLSRILSSFGIHAVKIHTDSGELTRISSTLANPAAFSTYLVLACPLVIHKIYQACTELRRNFWFVSFFLVTIGILLAQSRTGIFAFLICTSIFLARKSRLHLKLFILFFAVILIQLIFSGGERFNYRHIKTEIAQKTENTRELFHHFPKETLIFGVGAKNLDHACSFSRDDSFHGLPEVSIVLPKNEINNMYIMLLLENGILGLFMMMLIIIFILKEIVIATKEIMNKKEQDLLWAIFSAIIGFLICMYASNVFFYLPIQILFWALAGLAMGISVHNGGKNKPYHVHWDFSRE